MRKTALLLFLIGLGLVLLAPSPAYAYIGPGPGGPRMESAVFRAYRYAASYAGLVGKDLTPGKTIEALQAK